MEKVVAARVGWGTTGAILTVSKVRRLLQRRDSDVTVAGATEHAVALGSRTDAGAAALRRRIS